LCVNATERDVDIFWSHSYQAYKSECKSIEATYWWYIIW